MATTLTLSTTAKNAAANAVVDLVDAGSGAGKLVIKTGVGGTVLAQLTMSDPAFGDSVAGVATASAITADNSADNTGTAAYFEIQDSDGNVVYSGSVGATGSGNALEINTTALVAGIKVEVTSLTYTQG